MLTLTHVITGAALGQRVDNIFIAFLLGIILHLILDKVPHFWPEQKKHNGIILIVDGVLTTAFLIFLLFLPSKNPFGLLAGALGGAIVDAFFVLTPLRNTKVGVWHSKRQDHRGNIFFYATDALIIAGALVLIYLFK
jgi:hypothetical protein